MAVVWTRRAGATAGNVNGGGFDSSYSGTDYTQQDAAQHAETHGFTKGYAIIPATESYPCGAADKGNIINIISGTGVFRGRYLIVDYIQGSNWVVDQVTDTGMGDSVVFNMGGSLSDDFNDDVVPIDGDGGSFAISNGKLPFE